MPAHDCRVASCTAPATIQDLRLPCLVVSSARSCLTFLTRLLALPRVVRFPHALNAHHSISAPGTMLIFYDPLC